MKKTLSILTAFILLFELTYSATPVERKASYVAGSMGIGINTRGTLQVGEEALTFIYMGNRYEIPYEQITQLQYSKKKKAFDNISLKPNLPGASFATRTTYDTFSSKLSAFEIIMMVLTVVALIIAITVAANKSGKYRYLNIIYEEDGKTNWATFKIKRDDFQKILLTLSSKSGIEIRER